MAELKVENHWKGKPLILCYFSPKYKGINELVNKFTDEKLKIRFTSYIKFHNCTWFYVNFV